MSIYGFWQGPSYRPSTRDELFGAALEQPMSLGATFWDQAKGGVLESFGLGTAIRTLSLPPAAQTRRGRETDAEYQARQERVKGITEEEYKASPYYRDGVPWDSGMTEDRAAALATMYDAKRVREYFAEKRPITAFFGNLAGQATDPINYIPVAGPSVKAAAVARMGVVKGVAATAALDAAANTAIAGLATRETRRSFGDDVSWQAMVSEIATAALLGTAFGTVGGLLERRAGLMADALRSEAEVKVNTLRATQEARIALNEAIGGLANDGEVRLSPNAVAPIERVTRDVEISTPARISPDRQTTAIPTIERPEFKDWFSQSKVVDEDGAPLVVYHGGSNSIDAFKPNSDGLIYMTSNPELASDYATVRRSSGAVYPVYASLKNPLVVDRASDLTSQRTLIKMAREGGNDGLILKNADDSVSGMAQRPTSTVVIAFEPSQIKSKFNTGSFSRSDPRIIDASPARPEPLPTGRAEAEAKVAKPENYKALADQYRVDPEAGTFPEEAELRQLAQAGRLSDEDMAVLDDADAAFQDGAAYGKALESVVSCLV